MNQFWRASTLTGVSLFLEACAFYLLIAIISVGLNYQEVGLPFWLVLLTLVWSFLLSFYVQTLRFSLNLRGVLGLIISVISILVLSHWSTGLGLIPVGTIINGDAKAIVGVLLTLAFAVLLWWRGSTIAHDDVTLDMVSGAFRWGMIMVFAAVLIDSLTSARIINGFLVLGFFGVGLAGLSLARFSSETSDPQVMPLDWFIPIGISVGAVLVLGLVVSLVGLGGLDDVTRAILRMVGTVGLWVLKPIFLGLGYLVSWLIDLVNWLSSLFGGGDLSEFNRALAEIQQMRENLQAGAKSTGPPSTLVALLKWSAFLAVAALTGWLLFRIFHFRRFLREPREVEETRESLFSWSRANQDLSLLLSEWWRNLVGEAEDRGRRSSEPRTPRELYHSLLALAEGLGYARQEWQTPKEHQRMLQELLPPGPVERIVDDFQKVHYGRSEVDDVEMGKLLQDWTAIRLHVSEHQRNS